MTAWRGWGTLGRPGSTPLMSSRSSPPSTTTTPQGLLFEELRTLTVELRSLFEQIPVSIIPVGNDWIYRQVSYTIIPLCEALLLRSRVEELL